MALDARGATARCAVVDTNVFELCELKTLRWRVFGVQQHGDERADHENGEAALLGDHDAPSSERAHAPPPREAFAAFATAATASPTALTAWEEHNEDELPRLWVFSVNHAQPLPDEASVRVVAEGAWTRDDDSALRDATALQWLFRALHAWLAKKLLASGDFRVERELFCLNEARFVYRRPSLTRVNHFDVFLDEAFAASGFALHFQVLPSGLLCVNVEMVHQDAAAATVGAELGGLAGAWMRLMGLPSDRDFSMVDVWHTDDSLAARTVAETKYDNIYPQFRAFPRRKLGRRKGFDSAGDGSGENDDSNSGKGGKADGGNEHDGDDDNDGTNDGDDDVVRRIGALGKKKRRKPMNEAAENDDSIIPISPDTHVNSPDAGGPVVGMTFPHERKLLLHTDSDIHLFKRRRRKKKDSATNVNESQFKMAAGSSLSFGPLTPTVHSTKSIMPILARTRSGSQSTPVLQKPETPKTPALSLAVSLVASLTQDEEREALDSKPIKTHPLLQALDDYVQEEMTAHALRNRDTAVEQRATLVPNAPGFSPSVDERKKTSVVRFSSTTLTSVSYEQLRSKLLSDRFKRHLTGYYPRDFKRNKRQQRREHERRILLDYDETKLLEYDVSKSKQQSLSEYSVRDQEIAIGIRLAALDALIPWRLCGKANSRWTPYKSSSLRAADERDTLAFVHHLTPHLTELQTVVKEKNGGDITSDDEAGEVHDPWMTLERYCTKKNRVSSNDESAEEMRGKQIEGVPRLCVATVESALHVEIPAISEYTLRNLQPVAAPKPVDFALVCPHSPAQWLGTLTLSYLSMFQSTYGQSAMGDQMALDLSALSSTTSVQVDVSNAALLVDCATSSRDAFACYREAGEMLRPLLSQGVKRKQAFSRSPVANVIYLVAPFRRTDIKHKLWLLGAFGRGVFGDEELSEDEDDWTKTVTLELLYLEDLINVSVDADPYALLPAAMSLYNRVFERVTLNPIANGDAAATSRYICERLYHLADTEAATEGNADSDSNPALVHAGFTISSDGKWLLAGFCDALGAVLETRTIAIAAGDLSSALIPFVELALEFVALLGEKATLVISQLLPSPTAMSVDADAWRELTEEDVFPLLTRRFEPVVSKIVVCQASFLDKESVQVRPLASTVAKANEKEGVLVIRPDDTTVLQERSRVANSKWLRSAERRTQQTAVLHVRQLHSITVSDAAGFSRDEFDRLLTDWSSLSYLTTHPITLERQSPLPLHLAVVDELYSELELLAFQLTTDPLALRR